MDREDCRTTARTRGRSRGREPADTTSPPRDGPERTTRRDQVASWLKSCPRMEMAQNTAAPVRPIKDAKPTVPIAAQGLAGLDTDRKMRWTAAAKAAIATGRFP